ncbi:rho GTPase-activating protein 32-like, partial [Meleagris gallopavo]|uniref:rho GTPase-activating protein 32-like n=1 Tax=Meleagris gallopavo TaxID=9103 RepID=UPI00093B2F60
MPESGDMEVEEGPAAVQGKFHSVIDFPSESNDGLCASISGELLGSTNGCSSIESLPSNNSDGHKELVQVQALISPSCAEDADLSLPDTTVTSLD